MNRLMSAARLLAIALAIIAVFDPSFTVERYSRPEISVVAAAGGSGDAVAQALAKDYTVIRAPLPGVAATVIVGNVLPAGSSELTSPVFAVAPARSGTAITIENVRAAPTASSESRLTVRPRLRVTAAKGRQIDVGLISGGVVVDRVSRSVETNDEQMSVVLSLVPPATGATALQVAAKVRGTSDSAVADVTVDIRQDRWAVLFFDRRPSWMSTFVRRSLENDRRFVVTSRIVTSKNVSTDAGRPPSTLEDPTLLELYDAIIVGAPEAATDRDIVGLEAFLRRRGGGVVLLFDERATGRAPVDRLTNVTSWAASTGTNPMPIESVTGEGGLRATELMWPIRIPPAIETLATISAATAEVTRHPVVWSTPVGAGQLIVSGALDAWAFRDSATSGFDAFWRSTIAAVADGSIPPIRIEARPSMARPGEAIEVGVVVRDALLAPANRPASASVSASLGDGPTRSVIRLWPTGLGRFAGTIRAPARVGQYRVRVVAGAASADVPVVVATDALRASPDDRELLSAWVGTRRGKIVEREQLRRELAAVIKPQARMEPWYPMRAWWWMAVVVGLLAAEWWWRRRQGLA